MGLWASSKSKAIAAETNPHATGAVRSVAAVATTS